MKTNRASRLLFWSIMVTAAWTFHYCVFHQPKTYCIDSSQEVEFEYYFDEGLKGVPHCGWEYPREQIRFIPHCKQMPYIEAAKPFKCVQVPLFEEIEIP